MAESDTKNPAVQSKDTFDRVLRAVQTVGFPIVVAAFLLWEWHSTVRTLQDTMAEVKSLLVEVRTEIKKGPR